MDERKIPQCILNIFKFTANSTDLFDWGAHLSPSCWTLMLTGKVQQKHFQMYYDCSLSASLQKRFQIICVCSLSASLPAGSRWSTSAHGAGAEREIEQDEKVNFLSASSPVSSRRIAFLSSRVIQRWAWSQAICLHEWRYCSWLVLLLRFLYFLVDNPKLPSSNWGNFPEKTTTKQPHNKFFNGVSANRQNPETFQLWMSICQSIRACMVAEDCH